MTAVEFAFIATPFFVLLMALLEIGLVFFGTLTLESAVEQASRLIRTGQAQTQGLTAASFKNRVCSHISGLIDCAGGLKVDVKRFDNFSGVTLDDPLDGNGELRDDFGFNPGAGGDIVVVRAFYEWDLTNLFPDLGMASGLANMGNGNRLIIGTAAFRNEPFN